MGGWPKVGGEVVLLGDLAGAEEPAEDVCAREGPEARPPERGGGERRERALVVVEPLPGFVEARAQILEEPVRRGGVRGSSA